MAKYAAPLLALLAFSPVGHAFRSSAGAARQGQDTTLIDLCTEEKLTKVDEETQTSLCQLVHAGKQTPEGVVASFDKIMKLAPDTFEPCTIDKVVAICGPSPVFTCEEKLDQVAKEHFERVEKYGLPKIPDEDSYKRMLCYLVDSETHDAPNLYKPCTRETTSPFCESIRTAKSTSA